MIVVDANVVLSGLRSRNGASNAVLQEMVTGGIEFALSPAIALEYEDVLKRPGLLGPVSWISTDEIDVVLDAIFAGATLIAPWFRFRPFLDDAKDDMYVECALAAGAQMIISNDRHFKHPALSHFGLRSIKAGDYLAGRDRRE